MASNIKFKRSAVQNRVPTTAQLDLGELALNTYDGKLYTEINTGSAAVVEIGSKLSSLVVDGANGAGGGDVVFHGATGSRDLTWDYSANTLKVAEEAFIKFGTHEDFQISHGYALGSENTLIDQTTGKHLVTRVASSFHLRSNSSTIWNYAQNRKFLQVNNTSQDIKLYFNNLERITTTNDGADIGGTGSLKIPVGTTAQRSASPVAGDLRYNTTTSSFEGYSTAWGDIGAGGIGVGSDASNPRTGIIQNRVGVGFTDLNIVGAGISVTGYGTTVFVDFNEFKPGSFHRTIHNYTATAGQTTFAGLNYEVSEKQIAVYLNGARLSEATYTATSGTTVVLDVGASVGDEVEIINIHTNSDVDRKVNTYTATAGQTTFTGLSYNSKTELDVYLNGIRLASDDFTATSGNTVVLAVGASVNDTVDIVSTGDGVTWRSTTDASGDVYKLTNVGIGTDQTPDKLNVRGNVNIVGVLTATTLHGDGSNLTNTGSTLSEPSSGTQRLVTTSLTTGTMTSSGTGSELAFDYSNNHLEFSDDTHAVFGTGGDMHIYHDGSASHIGEFGTGDLRFTTNGAKFDFQKNGGEILARFITDGAVQLYHDNSKKFETASDGTLTYGAIKTNAATATAGSASQATLDYNNGNTRLLSWNASGASSFSLFTRPNGGSFTEWFRVEGDGGVKLPVDNQKLYLGTGHDFFLFHNGSNSYIDNLTGALYIRPANNFFVQNRDTGEVYLKGTEDGAVDLYYNGTKRFETTSTGASVTGNLAVSGVLTYDDVTNVDSVGIITARAGVNITGGNITLGDSGGTTDDRIVLGAGSDLQIFHNGTNSLINNTLTTGSLFIKGDSIQITSFTNTEKYIAATKDGAVELYYDNSKKFETASHGVTFFGTSFHGDNIVSAFGASSDLQIYHNGSSSFIDDTGTGNLNIRSNQINFDKYTGEALARFRADGNCELFHNNVSKFETTADGVTVNGVTVSTGNIQINNDTGKIRLGANQDLDIIHDGNSKFRGTSGYTQISATNGSVYIDGNSIFLRSGAGNENYIKCIDDGAVELYHNDAKKLETHSGGATVQGQLGVANTSSFGVSLSIGDSAKAAFGASDDLQIYHDATNGQSIIDNNTGTFIVRSDGGGLKLLSEGNIILRDNDDTTNMVRAINGGQIELYHNGTKKLQTDSAGTIFYDDTFLGDNLKANFGNNADLQLFHDGSHTYINNATGTLHIRGQGDGIRVQQTNGEDMAKFIPNGAVELYHDNTKRLETTSSGVEIPQALFVGEKIDMPDHTSGTNGMILLGTGDDLYMYHDGTNSHLRNNTGTFNVRAGNFRLTDAAIQHVYLNANGNGNDEVSLYYDNSVKLVTTNTGIEVSGEIQLDDGNPIKFGNGPDTNIHHDGSNTYIHHSGTGSLIARVVNRAFRVYGDANATIANFIDNGAVELYHNNNKKFETTSSGVDVTGTITMDAVPGTNTNAALPVLFQTSAGVIDGGSQLTYNPGGDVLKVNGLTLSSSQVRTSGNTALQLTTANANGTVDLIVRTTHVECNGHLLPATNNTDDLGSSSTRWRNIYTNDLNLSNEGGGGNDVDGTTGNYTIQEGADELYLINNKSGKKYKFNLTEVS